MITATRQRKPKRLDKQINLETLAREALERHIHFRGRSDGFQFKQRDGMLVVLGCVPSFYLRESLHKALERVDGAGRIDNQVDVVCSHGLSSVREP